MKSRFFLVLFISLLSGSAYSQLPDNMYADSLHFPFLEGVASGDPLQDRVILWTRITPQPYDNGSINVYWEIAKDSSFNYVINEGNILTDSTKDYTVKVDADGLTARSVYYYRFYDEYGNYSVRGRTRTAPSGNISQVRFAILYGTSVYSGFFNAYRKIAEKNDIDAILHLGDYVYDFVDTDEQVRVAGDWQWFEEGGRPSGLDDYRYLHRYYLWDPDFRYARRQHPMIVIWDNHDVDRNNPYSETIQAFYEYVPVRMPDEDNPWKIYRRLNYGSLVDLYMIDVWMFKDMWSPHWLLGNDQYAWFAQKLLASTSTWNVICNQKPMGGWDLFGPLVSYNSNNTWDGYEDERDELFHFLNDYNINNNVVLSGDAHLSIAMNLEISGEWAWDPDIPVGVEMMPPSVSRGNLDEMGYGDVAGVVESSSMAGNSHHVWCDFTSQGYGILNITEDKVVAEYWFVPILEKVDYEISEENFICYLNENRWSDDHNEIPTSGDVLVSNGSTEINDGSTTTLSNVFPDPCRDNAFFTLYTKENIDFSIEIIRLSTGKSVFKKGEQSQSAGSIRKYSLPVSGLSPGLYSVLLRGNGIYQVGKFVKAGDL